MLGNPRAPKHLSTIQLQCPRNAGSHHHEHLRQSVRSVWDTYSTNPAFNAECVTQAGTLVFF